MSAHIATLGHASVSMLFVAMAALQLNDPDPLLWVVVYLAIAVIAGARIFDLRLPAVFWVTVGMAAACLMISLPGFLAYLVSGDLASVGGEMSPHKPYVEPAREFLGIVIGAISLFFYRNGHGLATSATSGRNPEPP